MPGPTFMRRPIITAIIVLVGAGTLAMGGLGIALALEDRDSFCASCHTEPESMYFQRSFQAHASDLASFHAQNVTRCIDCHSGAGLFGRAAGLQQGAHDLVNFVRRNYHSPAITLNPLGDNSCVKCHAKILERPAGAGKAGTNHYHFYIPQWRQVDVQAAKCIDCHAPHTNGVESLKFMLQGKVGSICENCHDALSGVVK